MWIFFFSSRRRHTRLQGDWSSDVCSSDLKQDTAGLGAGALPGMRDIARHEGATARAADRDLVADQERDLALQDVGNFVAVVVQVERAFRAGWHGFFEHHHAVGSVGAAQFRHDRATRRKALHRAFAGLHDDALCGHGSLLSRVPQSGEGPTISHWYRRWIAAISSASTEATGRGRFCKSSNHFPAAAGAYMNNTRPVSMPVFFQACAM